MSSVPDIGSAAEEWWARRLQILGFVEGVGALDCAQGGSAVTAPVMAKFPAAPGARRRHC